MTTEAEKTEWSLPGPAVDMPRDKLNLQLEVYDETLLLRGFEGDADWVKTVSADEIANVFIQHLGASPRGCCPRRLSGGNQGETGQVVALWRPPQVWPVALQREAFKPPARLRLPMPGLVFVCSPGRAPWVYAALERPAHPDAACSTGCPPSTSSVTGGFAPEATSSRRRWDSDTRSPSSSPTSRAPGTPATARRSTPTTCTRYGRSWMERLSTRLRTLFDNGTVAQVDRGLRREAGLWLPLAAGLPRLTGRRRSATSSIT